MPKMPIIYELITPIKADRGDKVLVFNRLLFDTYLDNGNYYIGLLQKGRRHNDVAARYDLTVNTEYIFLPNAMTFNNVDWVVWSKVIPALVKSGFCWPLHNRQIDGYPMFGFDFNKGIKQLTQTSATGLHEEGAL